jgi:NADH:ubiquinone oxidoreductase subunit 4 (subunit M)
MLITLAILVILFGFYPSPLMDTLNISVDNLINNYEIAIRANGLN